MPLGREAITAMFSVEDQQQRIAFRKLLTMVGAEKSYHQNVIATLDELHAEMILEKQLNESSSQLVTMQRDADVPPVLDDTISDGPDVPQDEHQNDSYFIAKVIHSFDAQAKGELSLLVDDYVVVRQASLVTTASLHLYAIVDGLKGECQGDAGWFPSAYVERGRIVPNEDPLLAVFVLALVLAGLQVYF
ncbi:hypothetical protein TEA_029854 [Camellia sinensis var. sinensis]|uniref:SH3 domain-containing protein n=1 Tax=Camellia sinensis var. sinensis TaxID=542762 RepID=A0A4S4EVI2_CAMSN|nr:hypothetical protein TEA_029854 [Camellia sinensis var. sinensis]